MNKSRRNDETNILSNNTSYKNSKIIDISDSIMNDFYINFYNSTNFFETFEHYKPMLTSVFNYIESEEQLYGLTIVLLLKMRLNKLDNLIKQIVADEIKKYPNSKIFGGSGEFLKILRKEVPKIILNVTEEVTKYYLEQKLRSIARKLNSKDPVYLDEILSISKYDSIKYDIIKKKSLKNSIETDDLNESASTPPNIYNSYINKYNMLMNNIKMGLDKYTKIPPKNHDEIYRFYMYRKIMELETNNEKFLKQNKEFREKYTNLLDPNVFYSILYSDPTESTLVDNVTNILRDKVTYESKIMKSFIDKLKEETSLMVADKDDKMRYLLDNFKTDNRIIEGGTFMNLDGDGVEYPKDKKQIELLLYSVLRTADTIHDFYVGSRTESSFKRQNLYENITFSYSDIVSKFKNSIQIINDFNKKMFFNKKLKFIKDNELIDTNGLINIDINDLLYILWNRTSFEDNTINKLNKFIFRLINVNDSLKSDFILTYRPSNLIIHKVINQKDIFLNEFNYVKKEELIKFEDSGQLDLKSCFTNIEPDIYNNLAFIVYDKSILLPEKKKNRENIINAVTKFIGSNMAKVSVDYQSHSNLFFEIFEKEKSTLFRKPKKNYAELWDPAINKSIKSINEIDIIEKIDTGILDINGDNKRPFICSDNYDIKLLEVNNKLYADAGVSLEKHMKKIHDKDMIEVEGIDGFSPEVKKIASYLSKYDSSQAEKICKLFYLKNSGDWGQVSSCKQNKSFLITEDKLCSYYSFLTNTSTIYTYYKNGVYVTMIHKGKLERKLTELIESIKTNLIFYNYYLFFKSLHILLKIDNKNVDINFKITFEGISLSINYVDYDDIYKNAKNIILEKVELIEEENIPLPNIDSFQKILGGNPESRKKRKAYETLESNQNQNQSKKPHKTIIPINLLLTPTIIKTQSKFLELDIEVINIIKKPIEKKLIEKQNIFLESKKSDIGNNDIKKIYDECFNDNYLDIIKGSFTNIKIDDYIYKNLIDKLNKNILYVYFSKIKIDYTQFKNYLENNIPSLVILDNKLQWVIKKDDKKNSKSNTTKKEIKEYFGGSVYKTINESKNSYNLDVYNYNISADDTIDSDILLISSLLTNGTRSNIWDIFNINPLIMALFYKYLESDYKKVYEIPITNKKLKDELNKFYEDLIENYGTNLKKEYIIFSELLEYQINTKIIGGVGGKIPTNRKNSIVKSPYSINSSSNDSKIISHYDAIKNHYFNKINIYDSQTYNFDIHDFRIYAYLYSITKYNSKDIWYSTYIKRSDKENFLSDLKKTIGNKRIKYYSLSELPTSFLNIFKKITVEENTKILSLIENKLLKEYFNNIKTNLLFNINPILDSFLTKEKIIGDLESYYKYYNKIFSIIKTFVKILENNIIFLDYEKKSNIEDLIKDINQYLSDFEIFELDITFKPEYCRFANELLEVLANHTYMDHFIDMKNFLKTARIPVPTHFETKISPEMKTRLETYIELLKKKSVSIKLIELMKLKI